MARSAGMLVLAALLPAAAWGQQMTLGPTISQIVSSGEGVGRNCLQPSYSSGLGVRFAVPVLTRRTTLQLAGRGYWLKRGSTCLDGFPPLAGVYIEEDRINLLSRSFITTDVRLATVLPSTPISLALGGGNAWHEGHDLPYLVFAAGAAIGDRPDVRVGLEAELQALRVTSDRFRRTYSDFGLVSEEPLGRVRRWSHAAIIGLSLAIPL